MFLARIVVPGLQLKLSLRRVLLKTLYVFVGAKKKPLVNIVSVAADPLYVIPTGSLICVLCKTGAPSIN